MEKTSSTLNLCFFFFFFRHTIELWNLFRTHSLTQYCPKKENKTEYLTTVDRKIPEIKSKQTFHSFTINKQTHHFGYRRKSNICLIHHQKKWSTICDFEINQQFGKQSHEVLWWWQNFQLWITSFEWKNFTIFSHCIVINHRLILCCQQQKLNWFCSKKWNSFPNVSNIEYCVCFFFSSWELYFSNVFHEEK